MYDVWGQKLGKSISHSDLRCIHIECKYATAFSQLKYGTKNDWLREPRNPRCNIQLQTSFFKPEDCFKYQVLDCVKNTRIVNVLQFWLYYIRKMVQFRRWIWFKNRLHRCFMECRKAVVIPGYPLGGYGQILIETATHSFSVLQYLQKLYKTA